MLTVAFIDDGINPIFLPEGVALVNYIVDENGVNIDESPVTEITHGTICYKVFKDNVDFPYRLISLRVLDHSTGTGNHKALAMALNWCANQDIDLINMSVGTRQQSDFNIIAQAVKQLQNVVIVAACSNQNELTFPACLPSVIGVRHCDNRALQGKFIYLQTPYDQIDVITYMPSEVISTSTNHMIGYGKSNSIATPFVSSIVGRYLSQGFGSLVDVLKKLKQDSAFDVSNFHNNHELLSLYNSFFNRQKKLTVPVIALTDNTSCANQKLNELITTCVLRGYRTIALSETQNTNAEASIYSLNQPMINICDLIELYYNFTLPDMLFLQMNLIDVQNLPKSFGVEAVLTSHGKNIKRCNFYNEMIVLDLNNNVEDILNQIESLFA